MKQCAPSRPIWGLAGRSISNAKSIYLPLEAWGSPPLLRLSAPFRWRVHLGFLSSCSTVFPLHQDLPCTASDLSPFRQPEFRAPFVKEIFEI